MKHLGSVTADKDIATKIYADKGKVWFGVCATAAATQAKTVTIDGVTALSEGLFILVSFTNAQTYNGAPTLNLNSLGAKTVRRVTGTSAARYEWSAGEILPLVYNGTYWVILDGALATTTYYGVTKLSTGATSTSTATALTPASLNSLAQYMLSGVGVYSASDTYAVGDRVRYGYYIYECKTAITTAEAWNSAHWTALGSLQAQIDELGAKIFIAEYGTTTSAQIEAAYQAGAACFCRSGNMILALCYRDNSPAHWFSALKNNIRYSVFCDDDVWSTAYVELAAKDSPTFTGTPKAPTASAGTNTTQIATTAFVKNAIDGAIFRAVYDETTSAEIEAAYQAGKLIYCIYNSRVYYLVYRYSATNHQFTNVYSSTRYSVACSNNNWTNASGTL